MLGDGLRREFNALGEWDAKREAALKAQAGGGDGAICCEYLRKVNQGNAGLFCSCSYLFRTSGFVVVVIADVVD